MRRIWFITDTHFGVRANSVEWMDIQREYFENFFFPLVKKHYQPGDVLFHLGDVFDSRQAINLKVLNLATEVFETLSAIFVDGIFVICGNHDIYNKSSNEINSLVAIKHIPNVNVFEEPTTLNVGGKSFAMMPWRRDHLAEHEFVEDANEDYLCCHADIQGLKFNNKTMIEAGCTIDEYAKFKRVYSGHIHYAQRRENIAMLGSPYQITRSDRGNTKAIVLLDPATDTEMVFENTYSPKFIFVDAKDLLQRTPQNISDMFANNFVDISVDSELLMKLPVGAFVEEIPKLYKRIDFQITESVRDTTVTVHTDDALNIEKLIASYVGSTAYDQAMKDKLQQSLVMLYHKAEQSSLQSV